jgi:hypothetical protein
VKLRRWSHYAPGSCPIGGDYHEATSDGDPDDPGDWPTRCPCGWDFPPIEQDANRTFSDPPIE